MDGTTRIGSVRVGETKRSGMLLLSKRTKHAPCFTNIVSSPTQIKNHLDASNYTLVHDRLFHCTPTRACGCKDDSCNVRSRMLLNPSGQYPQMTFFTKFEKSLYFSIRESDRILLCVTVTSFLITFFFFW